MFLARIFPYFLFIVLLLLSPAHLWASACCARTPAAPFLIVGDDKAQLSVGVGSSSLIAQAGADGALTYEPSESLNRIWNYRLDGAFLLSDRWQMGLSVPVVTHSIREPGIFGSTTGIGDGRLSIGYEILPSWSYSKWKPQGFVFSVISFPTGRSSFEASNPNNSDVTGNGFFAASLGTLLMKRWTIWDVFFLGEVHYSFPRTFSNAGGNYQVFPGMGASGGIGIGYSPGGGRLRLGLRIQPRWDQLELIPSRNSGATGTRGQRWTNDTGLDVSYLVAATDTVMISYTDQTLIGPVASAPLNRMFALNFQHRWER